MVKVCGYDDGQKEYEAALQLRAKILSDFPELEHDANQQVFIFSSVKTPWVPKTKDVDLYVLARFQTPLEFDDYDRRKTRCWSLSLSLEVKTHVPPGVWLEGDDVWCMYPDGPERATEQAFRQPFALHSFLKRKGFEEHETPYVQDFLWLTQAESTQFAAASAVLPIQLIFSDTSFIDLLRRCVSLQAEAYRENLNLLRKNFRFADAVDAFSRIFVPTRHSRAVMQRLLKHRYKHKALLRLGEAQISFSGLGGSGKTGIMIRAAKELYESGRRCLILTYHSALTSDLYRQLQVIGLRSNAFGQSVTVETLHRFFVRWLIELQEVDQETISEVWFKSEYISLLTLVNKKIFDGEITQNEITAIKTGNPSSLKYEYLFIDEAQDWHDAERDFIYQVYNPRSIVVNLGRRQLIRAAHPCDWTPPAGVAQEKSRLTKSLRLKPNVARFVSNLAAELGEPEFRVVTADGSVGGNVFVVRGTLAENFAFVATLLTEINELDYKNVDHLFCVPPGADSVYEHGNRRYSRLGDTFRSKGYGVYDAVDREVRLGVPDSVDQVRIVQFDSSRGLEGWLVALDRLDLYFDLKLNSSLHELGQGNHAPFLSEELAKQRAFEWLFIPLTRATDTLVISIDDVSSAIGKAVLKVAGQNADCVQLIGFEAIV